MRKAAVNSTLAELGPAQLSLFIVIILPTGMKREIYAHKINCFIINMAELDEKLSSLLYFP